MRPAPELPDALLQMIGFFASDWAVIEQNLLLHALELSDHKPNLIPTGFNRLRKHWRRLALAALPEHTETIEHLNRRLCGRSDARNYVIHGYWRKIAPDLFETVWLDHRNNEVTRERLEATPRILAQQAELLRALRCDLVDFLNGLRHCPEG
jgi:hypothetical protein